jgi:hypothetical protein
MSEKCLHHLMRVRVRKSIFLELQNIASDESSRRGEYVSVSDLVRSSLQTKIQSYDATKRLRLVVNPKSSP